MEHVYYEPILDKISVELDKWVDGIKDNDKATQLYSELLEVVLKRPSTVVNVSVCKDDDIDGIYNWCTEIQDEQSILRCRLRVKVCGEVGIDGEDFVIHRMRLYIPKAYGYALPFILVHPGQNVVDDPKQIVRNVFDTSMKVYKRVKDALNIHADAPIAVTIAAADLLKQ